MSTLDVVAAHLTALGLRCRTADDGVILIDFSGDNTLYEAAIEPRGPMMWVVVPTVSMIPRPRLEETIRVANLLNAGKVILPRSRPERRTGEGQVSDTRSARLIILPAPSTVASRRRRMAGDQAGYPRRRR